MLSCVLLAMALLAVPARAQRLQFRRITGDEGLAGSQVRDILQDHHGFMWFGTTNGLNRYDGYRARFYRHERNNPKSLANGDVYALLEDRSGTLWVATRGGVSRYDRDRDEFVNYYIGQDSTGAGARPVASMLEDSHGNFWIGSGGLHRLDRRTGVARPYLPRVPGGLADEWIQVLHEDRRGHVWAGTGDAGLYEFDPRTGATRAFTVDSTRPGGLPDADIRAIVEDPAGYLWIGTYNAGLARLDPRSGAVVRYQHDPADPTSLAADRVLRLISDHAGGLWVGTEDGGLDHFDPATGVFEHNEANQQDPTRLSTNSVWALMQDASGLLWVASFAGDVRVAAPNNRAIRYYANQLGVATTLSQNRVLGFAEGADRGIWIATDGGGLNRLDRETDLVTSYRTSNSDLNADGVLAVAADHDGGVWIGTWGGGISHFDPRTKHFTPYTSRNTNLPDDNVFALCVDRRGRLWVGTREQGLLLFDRERKRFREWRLTPPGATQSQVWVIRETHDGKLLIGTSAHGLLVFDPEAGLLRAYTSDPSNGNSLSSNDVRAVVETEPGVVWVGTASGLDRLDRRTGRITHVSEEDGLASSVIAALAADRSGRLWISTNRGIDRFDPRTHDIRRYTVTDGLQDDEFNPRAAFRASDGALFFGGNRGFNLILPEQIQVNHVAPRVVLTDFQLFNRPVPIGAPGSPLQRHITETRRLVLDHRQSVFTLEFAALDFTSPEKNRYAYRLEGFDREWVQAGANRMATYTNLPPGDYVFRVKASNNDGVWNEQGVSLPITILPPWWQTWWFRGAAALLVVAVVVAVTRNARARRRNLEGMNARLAEAAERDRRSHQYLESNVQEILGAMQRFSEGDYSVELEVRTDDEIGLLRRGFNEAVADRKRAEDELRQSQKMEAVGRLAGGVAHDFNNLLTVIKGNTDLILLDSDPTSAQREELEEVRRAAEQATALTSQLLAFSRKQILQPRLLSLNDVVTDVGRMLERTVGEDIRLELRLDPALGTVRADPGQVQQVILNLVVNARDAMPRGGELVVETGNADPASVPVQTAEAGTQYVALSVRDTGTGMEPSVCERIFEPFFTTKAQGKGTGLGLSTVYGIVSQSEGHVRVESEPGVGSTFTVYLPREAAAPEAHSVSACRDYPGGSEVVLLVEDEPLVRRLGTKVLERCGYTVLAAESGARALVVAEEYDGEIHLLLTDVVMPGMSGRELAEQLLPRRPAMRLLYTSGYTEDAIVHHGVSGRGTAFLEKPYSPESLAGKVREALAGARAAQSV